MRPRFTSLLVLLALISLTPAIALAQHPARIVVEGHGQMNAAPDRARIVLAIETQEADPETAARKNAERQNAALAALREAGVASADLSTLGYGVQPNWQWRESGRYLDGYIARTTLRVQTSELDRVGTLIDVAIGSGVDQVEGISFELSDPEAARRSALTLAVRNARAAAEAMAAAAGGRLGDLVELTTVDRGGPAPIPMMAMARAYEGESAKADTAVVAGELSVEATVTGVWAFVSDGS